MTLRRGARLLDRRAGSPTRTGSPNRGVDQAELRRRNRRWLEAYDRCRHAPEAISLRNRLVEHNLPLVLKVAADLRHHDGLPFDDMVQVGCLGLIRAIEAWDGRRGASLSSFAVPYIRGAIQREIRDRLALLRVPRPLWDLRQRARALQEQRRRHNLPCRSHSQLAADLGCSLEALEECLALARLASPNSLDAPLHGAEADRPITLLELLSDPASQGTNDPDPDPPSRENPEHAWLRDQLRRLDPAARGLLEGRLLHGYSWPDLAHRAGISTATARRRVLLLLRHLRQAGEAWRNSANNQKPVPP